MTQILNKLPRLVPEITDAIHKALVRINDEQSMEHEAERTQKTIGMGKLGKCPRSTGASINGIPSERPFTPEVLEIFRFGKWLEGYVIELLESAGIAVQQSDPLTAGEQFHHEALGGRVRGDSDGRALLMIDGDPVYRKVILEIKSAKESRFQKLVKLGNEKWNHEYYDTVQGYMGT